MQGDIFKHNNIIRLRLSFAVKANKSYPRNIISSILTLKKREIDNTDIIPTNIFFCSLQLEPSKLVDFQFWISASRINDIIKSNFTYIPEDEKRCFDFMLNIIRLSTGNSELHMSTGKTKLNDYYKNDDPDTDERTVNCWINFVPEGLISMLKSNDTEVQTIAVEQFISLVNEYCENRSDTFFKQHSGIYGQKIPEEEARKKFLKKENGNKQKPGSYYYEEARSRERKKRGQIKSFHKNQIITKLKPSKINRHKI